MLQKGWMILEHKSWRGKTFGWRNMNLAPGPGQLEHSLPMPNIFSVSLLSFTLGQVPSDSAVTRMCCDLLKIYLSSSIPGKLGCGSGGGGKNQAR